MSKISLTDLVNLQNETTAVNAINDNNAALTTAMDNTLSRDGTSPNQMGANLDMNSNRILNLPTPGSNYDPIRMIDVNTINGTGITVSPLPAGGTANQILTKNSSTNFDVSWATSSIPNGGTTGQVLAKNSSTDKDTGWTSTPTLTSINSGPAVLTFPNNSDILVGQVQATTLSNKTIDGSSNTFTNIPVSALNAGTGATSSTFWRGDGTWNSPPSGTYVFLETLSPSAVTSFNTTVSWSGYSAIEIVFLNLNSSNNTDPLMRVHSNGAYQNTSYKGDGFLWNLQLGGTSVSGNLASGIPLTWGGWSNLSPAGYVYSGTFRVFNPNNTSIFKNVQGTWCANNNGNTIYGGSVGCWTGGTQALDGCQFTVTAGTMTGTVKVYGIV